MPSKASFRIDRFRHPNKHYAFSVIDKNAIKEVSRLIVNLKKTFACC